jgi:putative MATE family efflux protein
LPLGHALLVTSPAVSRHDPAILRFAVPAMATLAADPLVSLVDTAFVGQLGTAALGALGVNAGIFALAFLVFNFLAYGTTPLVAGATGKGEHEEAAGVISAGVLLSVVLGLLGTAVLVLLAEPIATAMGTRPEMWEDTLSYLRIRAYAAPAVLLVTVGNGAFRGLGDTRTPLWVTLGLNLVNLVLDPVLMFGFGWGIAGAAWATLVAQWLGALAFVVLLLPKPAPTLRHIRQLLGVGSVLSIRTFSLIFTFTVITGLATRFGPEVIAAHQVAIQLWLLPALIIDSFALAGQSLVAEYVGAGRPGDAREVSDRLLVWGVRTGVVLALILIGGWYVWPWLFGMEAGVTGQFYAVLPIAAVMQPINAVVFVRDGTFMGAKAFGVLAVTMVVSTSITLAALVVVWTWQLGLVALWGCILLLVLLRAMGQAWFYYGPRSVLPSGG